MGVHDEAFLLAFRCLLYGTLSLLNTAKIRTPFQLISCNSVSYQLSPLKSATNLPMAVSKSFKLKLYSFSTVICKLLVRELTTRRRFARTPTMYIDNTVSTIVEVGYHHFIYLLFSRAQ